MRAAAGTGGGRKQTAAGTGGGRKQTAAGTGGGRKQTAAGTGAVIERLPVDPAAADRSERRVIK